MAAFGSGLSTGWRASTGSIRSRTMRLAASIIISWDSFGAKFIVVLLVRSGAGVLRRAFLGEGLASFDTVLAVAQQAPVQVGLGDEVARREVGGFHGQFLDRLYGQRPVGGDAPGDFHHGVQ